MLFALALNERIAFERYKLSRCEFWLTPSGFCRVCVCVLGCLYIFSVQRGEAFV